MTAELRDSLAQVQELLFRLPSFGKSRLCSCYRHNGVRDNDCISHR